MSKMGAGPDPEIEQSARPTAVCRIITCIRKHLYMYVYMYICI